MREEPFAVVPAPEFDLALTLNSGQVFHWIRCGDGYAGSIGHLAVHVEQSHNELLIRPAAAASAVSHYFALDHSLSEICATFPRDKAMAEAARFCRGLRIIRQPKWECLATFITSSLKQVQHIRQITLAIRRNYGRQLCSPDPELFSYPPPEVIAATREEELRSCKLGFRAKNLRATARLVAAAEFDLEKIDALDDSSALTELCTLPGVGPKIANCVLLFAFGRMKSFPIDVWMERVLRQSYFKRRKTTHKRLQMFSESYFGPFGGYAQQYLFHHARTRRAGGVTA
jgi:N-glycosylase/DNA lyase